MKPVVGIMACNRTVGEENAHAVMERYVRAAMTYGDCTALLIPPLADGFSASDVTSRLDGLMLTGSPSNIQSGLYGSEGGEGPFDEGRDAVSLAMIESMLTMGKPVFGICRGFQEINVVLGGSLRRDVGFGSRAPAFSSEVSPTSREEKASYSKLGNRIDHHAPDGTSFRDMFEHYHDVELTRGGWLNQAYSRDHLRVNSVHYQGIDRLGEGLTVEAVAPDGLVEAFSANISGAQVLAVQWHPEWNCQDYPDSQTFFHLMGQALRGETVAPGAETAHAKL